jgi:hypothetical protein
VAEAERAFDPSSGLHSQATFSRKGRRTVGRQARSPAGDLPPRAGGSSSALSEVRDG